MKKYVRWYDKDEYLGAFMILLEQLPREVQIEIANDMLLNIANILDINHDDFINNLSNNNPISYKRWYDYSPELHSAIESMKNLPKEKNAELISMISDIFFKYTSKDFDETMNQLIATRKMEENDK